MNFLLKNCAETPFAPEIAEVDLIKCRAVVIQNNYVE